MPVCPTCSRENPAGARFCNACAAPLEVPPPEEREERKVVSILFVDLVGFTGRSDRADPEDVRALLRPYHARVKNEIERFGGTVEKFIGDAVMAVFGAPVAHEDDAERAVRAGLLILEVIRELNAAEGRELAVRAAVNTGEALVSVSARPEAGEAIATGDVVNTASRLQQEAPIGGLVVGETTYRTTRPVIDYEELEPVVVKGKAEPLSVWRATGARARFGVDVAGPSATPFVGREHELALLEETYARMLRERSVQLVTVTGEPGVGKTRLLGELKAFVDDQPELVWWRQGRCLSYGEGITFWALGEIVKAQAGVLESDDPASASSKLETAIGAAVGDPGEREWLKGRLLPLVGVEGRGEIAAQAESFTAWRRFLESVAEARPLVLVFEDLHWGDAALLEFIEHLVGWSTGVPILVVCSARPELFERSAAWGGGKRNSTTISLVPLTDEETSHLLASLLSRAVLPAETQAALLERAGGNPLYAEEFVRMLTDRGILTQRGGIAADGDILVPETVQGLIAARLDTLTPERKALLQDASVIGKVFWAGALASMSATDERAVEEGLHELAVKELLRPSRTSSVAGESEYSFWHLLIRDVAYAQIPRALRASKHRAAAEWIERMAGDRVADHAELLAHHYAQALELARAAGANEEAEELESPALRFLLAAGDRALQLDVAKAETFYRQALDLLPADHPDRATALAGLAHAAREAGRLVEAESGYEEAIAGFRARKDLRALGYGLVRLSDVFWARGRMDRSRQALAEALEVLEGVSGPELARAYARTAGLEVIAGRPAKALEPLERALELADQFGAANVKSRALQFRGSARCQLGDVDPGLEDLREALRLGLERGLGTETGIAYVNLGDWVWLTEGPTEGLAINGAGIAFSEGRGLIHNANWLRAESLWMLFDLGHWDELSQIADQLIAWDRARGESQISVIALTYKARVLASRGDVAAAAQLQEEFLPRAREIGDPQVLAPALATAALIEQRRGRLDAAVAAVKEIEERAPHAWELCVEPEDLVHAARICVAAGELDVVERLVANAVAPAARHRHAVTTAEALLAEALGRLEPAAELYRDATERWQEFGFTLEHGQALLGEGRCLQGLGRPDEAVASLERARAVFAGLGARPLVAETDELLGQLAAARTAK